MHNFTYDREGWGIQVGFLFRGNDRDGVSCG